MIGTEKTHQPLCVGHIIKWAGRFRVTTIAIPSACNGTCCETLNMGLGFCEHPHGSLSLTELAFSLSWSHDPYVGKIGYTLMDNNFQPPSTHTISLPSQFFQGNKLWAVRLWLFHRKSPILLKELSCTPRFILASFPFCLAFSPFSLL